MTSDRIEKVVVLRAPRPRVWRALTDSDEFGTWFGAQLAGPFAPGARVSGRITTPGYEHLMMELLVERVEPETLFSFRWHPGVPEPGVDYTSEPTTLVEFRLAEVTDGTRLTVVESGFDQISPERRADAFRMDDEGWAEQVQSIERYITANPDAG
jgi:uncharacterized protein YndB with AHSA1/START domain